MNSVRHDLDAWAAALGVRTDGDAVAELRSLQRQAEELDKGLARLYNSVPFRPARRSEDLDWVAEQFRQANVKVSDGWQRLAGIRAAFEVHERGNS